MALNVARYDYMLSPDYMPEKHKADIARELAKISWRDAMAERLDNLTGPYSIKGVGSIDHKPNLWWRTKGKPNGR
jgi:hypothetical protein